MPLGESRVHVADRVKGVFGTILRDAALERSNPVGSFVVRQPRRDDPLLPDAMDALSLGVVRARRKIHAIANSLIEGRAEPGYSDRLVFEGFEPTRESPQARREEGHVG